MRQSPNQRIQRTEAADARTVILLNRGEMSMKSLLTILWCFVPALVSFGPLYMTGMATENKKSTFGSFMVATGLIIMFIMVNSQRKKMNALEKALEQRTPTETG